MKFVVALIRHETNTFSPVPTELSDFRRGTTTLGPADGEAARQACEGTNSAAAAYLDLARDMGAEVDFAVCANAVPSGLVTRAAFESLCDTVVHSARQGCDAILLDLHGAMVVEGYPDAEGELLRRLHASTPAGLPIGVALDFHANFSRELIRHATVVAGYCTYPHVDVYETGARVGRSIRALLEQRSAPVLLWRRLPMLTHMLRQTPAMQPMKDIMDRAMQAERDGEVLNASVFGGFPLSDIPCAGLSVVVVAERERLDAGEKLLDEARQAYADAGVQANVEPFIADMAGAYAWADLVVCRAGALTVSEVAAAGVAAIFVPLPHAVDDHQTRNALTLVDGGAAEFLPQSELTTASLAARLSWLAGRRETLLNMAQAARRVAIIDAAERVADECKRLATGQSER